MQKVQEYEAYGWSDLEDDLEKLLELAKTVPCCGHPCCCLVTIKKDGKWQ